LAKGWLYLAAVIDWLNFHNSACLHSTLGYVSPMQFEATWLAAQQPKAA
jgi:transposase InsO family protein